MEAAAQAAKAGSPWPPVAAQALNAFMPALNAGINLIVLTTGKDRYRSWNSGRECFTPRKSIANIGQ
jgi:hypothetical protein